MTSINEVPARIYTVRTDYTNEIVLPALGEYADEFDTDAITTDMTEWHTERNREGLMLDARTGYIERQDVAFWEVVEKHALDTDK